MHVVIGLVLAFVLIAVMSNRKTRGCRWRMDRSFNRDGETFYKCMACGAEDFSADGKPPRVCKKL